MLTKRILYVLSAILVLIAVLASRKLRELLPQFLAEYAGDTLWALMLFLLVSTLLAGRLIVMRASISLALAFLVEISQLYHAPWIDSIRSTTLGGLDSGLTSVCLKPSTRVSVLRFAGVGVWFVRSRKQSSM